MSGGVEEVELLNSSSGGSRWYVVRISLFRFFFAECFVLSTGFFFFVVDFVCYTSGAMRYRLWVMGDGLLSIVPGVDFGI